jgi:UDPglucose 6-dehydrogenase
MWNLEWKRVALFGLAFKAGTDDVRSAPALALARKLMERGAEVVGCDPMAADAAKEELTEMRTSTDPYEAAEGAHCVVICTEWPEFHDLDWARVRRTMAYPVLVDGRNLLHPGSMREEGFLYIGVGRGGRQAEPPTAGSDELTLSGSAGG